MFTELQNKLSHVKISQPVDLEKFPDFFIVGPQRTGTSWLHRSLEFHPQIFLSRPKEIHFFNYLKEPKHTIYRSNDLDWYLKNFNDTPQSYAKKLVSSAWRYREIYRPSLRGEATASYAILDEDIIHDILVLNPDIKIILMVRNPIERAWSHAKKDLIRNTERSLDEVAPKEFFDFFNDPYQISCGKYTAITDKWRRLLPEENFFIGFFDDVHKAPAKLLLDLYEFLGVRSDEKYLPTAINKIVNPTPKLTIPQEYLEMLKTLFGEEVDRLNKRYDKNWTY